MQGKDALSLLSDIMSIVNEFLVLYKWHDSKRDQAVYTRMFIKRWDWESLFLAILSNKHFL